MAALKFYQEVFGAETGDVMMEPGGARLMHGEIILDGHMPFLSDEFAERGDVTTRAPRTLGETTARITLQTDDPDAVVERAVARGASVLMPVQNMFWGARYGKIVDPFGHEWGINQQTKEQTENQTKAAAEEFFAKQQRPPINSWTPDQSPSSAERRFRRRNRVAPVPAYIGKASAFSITARMRPSAPAVLPMALTV
jgi:PhnB protein